MARAVDPPARSPRISIDVDPVLRRRLRLAAAQRDLTIRQYVLEAIEARLRREADVEAEADVVLSVATDPILGELWDNARDDAYDRLPAR
jgi:hypothetical protein